MKSNHKNQIKKLNNFKNKILVLISIFIFSFIIRYTYGNFELPLIGDSLNYFLYASEISIKNQIPNYTIGNNVWSIFLSGLFSILKFETVLEYMQAQKFLTVLISSLTVIPVYFITKKFFNTKLSFLGAIFFAVEPRLILNSSLGITEPLFIFLLALILSLFLTDNRKLIILSFCITAFLTMIRTEGIFLFFAISIIFLIKHRKDRLVIPRYLLILFLFIIILYPIMQYRNETLGHDGIFDKIRYGVEGHIIGSDNFSSKAIEKIGTNTQITFIKNGIINFSKFLGWDLIPLFILFLPIGIIFLLKNFNLNKATIVLSIISLSIPAFYAYSIPLEDTRYLFGLYPMLIIISLFGIEKIISKFKKENLVFNSIIVAIIFSSLLFLTFESTNYQYEKEIFQINQTLNNLKIIANDFTPESRYLKSSNVLIEYDLFYQHIVNNDKDNKSVNEIIPEKTILISTKDYSSLKEFILDNKNNNLTHIITDDSIKRQKFLREIFENESNYPFLEKEFDSSELGYNYHLKLFRINYDKYN